MEQILYNIEYNMLNGIDFTNMEYNIMLDGIYFIKQLTLMYKHFELIK